MPVTEEIQTFAAFQGKVSGNTIMGVSLIQEGPALGHGVFVDRKSLGQFKALAMAKGRVKAKLNHFSSVQDTVGYYENFRVSKGKCVHATAAQIAELIADKIAHRAQLPGKAITFTQQTRR